MTVTDFNEDAVRRDTAGKFSEKGHSAPDPALLASIEPTPEDVRDAWFTVDSLDAHFGAPATILAEDADGNAVASYWREAYGSRTGTRVTIDAQGEILQVEEAWVSKDAVGAASNVGQLELDASWHPEPDPYERTRHTLRGAVNRDRLAHAGILVHNEGAGTGVYGQRYLGGRAKEDVHDATEISKLVRRDIKRAQEFGALPENLEYFTSTSKFAGGQSISVRVDGIKDEQRYAELEPGFKHGRHPWASELDRTLDIIGNQWQDDQSDTMQDYFQVNYYFQVELPDERMQAFHAEEKAKAAAKRRAKKA